MAKLANRAKMTISSTGTGNITLASAVAGYQSFLDAGVSDGDQIRYIIEDNSGADWEIGTAAVSNNSTVLVRTVEESSAANNAALNLTSSAKVFIGVTAKDLDNAAPIFTATPPLELDLAKDGSTAVTLNSKAYDESGIPVQYSWDAWATGGTTIYDASSLPPQLASAPSINQSTGVYSLVGSSNASNYGTVNFRVKASDGVKVATHVSQLHLVFYTNPDIANMTYDTGKDLAVSSQDGDPWGMWMNPAGTKLFVLGVTTQEVYEYDLSTADDISTATYNNVSLSITNEVSSPTGLCFSPEGNNLYVVCRGTDKVHQYSLTTAYDLSTGSFANKAFSVGSQEGFPAEVRFNATGTRMFVVGWSSDYVNQYDLSTAYDVSTASYNNVRFSIGSQEPYSKGLHFNNNGTKMYMIGSTNDDIFEYDLTTGFDVSTASYNDVKSPGSSVAYNPTGIFVNNDGTKFYVIDDDGPIKRYTSN